jgi:hypothetical protein
MPDDEAPDTVGHVECAMGNDPCGGEMGTAGSTCGLCCAVLWRGLVAGMVTCMTREMMCMVGRRWVGVFVVQGWQGGGEMDGEWDAVAWR